MITIRDLRLHWPATERALALEHELVITRDGNPVAKLVRLDPQQSMRKRWQPERHKQWLQRFWKNDQVSLVEKFLVTDRSRGKTSRPR
jgi:antitoxin (DNA-binding transcriptional repressor) of toxin-antitoxin stability system